MIDFIITDASKEGIIAGALMLYKHNKFNIYSADQNRFGELIKEMSEYPPYTLFIAGIPIVDEQLDMLIEAFNKMKLKETKIFYYDNHQWVKNADKLLESYFKKMALNNDDVPAIVFYKENWRKKDHEPTKIASLLVDDYVLDQEWREDWDLYIEDLLSQKKLNFKAIEGAMQKLAQDKDFSFLERIKINKLRKSKVSK